MNPINVGIIGTGRHGARYANHIINDLDCFRLTAISRRSLVGLDQAAQWNADWHGEWRDLISDPRVEAIIAATPPNLNLEIAKACSTAQKPLLIEKPLAINTTEAEQIVNLFSSNNTPLTVGHTLRYNATIKALKHELPKAGELYSFYTNQRLEKALHRWLDDENIAGGGVILHTAVHMFDALRFVTGREITRVRASMFCRDNTKLENLFTAQIEMEKNLVGTMDASKVGPARAGRYEFVGSKGQLQGDQVHGFMEFIKEATITQLPHAKQVSTIVPLLKDWHKFLQGKGPNPIPGEDGLAAVRICDACRQSALEDKWVSIIDGLGS
ncbi:MAG: Gfo/Idh/MocA family oxidoreductase [Proteobacteria bacterium]|nr:Gfo/Idh/MocA family oxidoreductase [Pseudomonadota bacterium]